MNSARINEDQNGLIVIEEERLKESFTQIPNTILRRPELSAGAKLTYMLLLSYAWQQDSCFPGQSTLAADLGAGRRSVIRYLQELQQVGLLRVKRRGLGKTNLYTLTKWQQSGSAKLASPEMPTMTSLQVSDWHRKNTQETNTQKNKDSLSNQFDGKETNGPTANSIGADMARPSVDDRLQRHSNDLISVGDVLKKYRDAEGLRPKKSPARMSDRTANIGLGLSGSPRAWSPRIEAVIDEFSSELGDREHVVSNTSQALRIWAESGVSELRFVSWLYQARSRTRQAAMESRMRTRAASSIRRRMPYFFACLRDLLTPSVEDATGDTSENDVTDKELETGDVRV